MALFVAILGVRLWEGLPGFAGLPDAMQDDGQFAGYGDDGSLLSSLAA